MMVWVDLLLLLGATLRVIRMVTTDDIPGTWYIYDPLDRWLHGGPRDQWRTYDRLHLHWQALIADGADPAALEEPLPPPPVGDRHLRWHRYLEGLGCPFCIGFWITCLSVLVFWLVGGPGDAADVWRWIAGALSLAYVAGHISSRMD
jgi:hypothetical protein